MAQEHPIDVSVMPVMRETTMDFRDTSFFASGPSNRELPSPDAVLEKSNGHEGIVRFEDLQLIVKVGSGRNVCVIEALSTRWIRNAFPNNEVPVPEVFGWRVSGHRVFIYMALVPGSTVEALWPMLSEWEKESIASQLRAVVSNLKRLRQMQQPSFIGSVCRGTIQDVYFRFGTDDGPFESVKEFHDRLEYLITPGIPMSDRSVETCLGRYYRQFLPDNFEVQFCHGDLNLTNVLVSGAGFQISGIIDWEQAGWYPEYWEYCKMHFGTLWSHEWRASGWIEKVITPTPYASALVVMEEYWSYRCP